MPNHAHHRTPRQRSECLAFTLVELVITLLLATCLIGLTIGAYNEADRLARGLQGPRAMTFEQRAEIRRALREQAAQDNTLAEANAQESAPPALSDPNTLQTSGESGVNAPPIPVEATLP